MDLGLALMGKTHPPDTENNGPKELVRLCRAGRLYEIERWINDGKSLEIPARTKGGRQRSLLEIAVETGFSSLVELIAKHEASQSTKDAALGDAVSSRRMDLVELLLASGADVKSVHLTDVLLTCRRSVDRGTSGLGIELRETQIGMLTLLSEGEGHTPADVNASRWVVPRSRRPLAR
jgi:hypothetical protein